jgi:hypothetical protein
LRAVSGGENDCISVVNANFVVDSLFRLTAFSAPSVTELCYNGRYWQACLVLILIASYNTATVAARLWQIATVRALMETIILNQFHLSSSAEVVQRERQLKERDLAAEREAMATIVASGGNALPPSTLLVRPTDNVVRQPPLEFLKKLQQLDGELKLGVRFCASRSPDFVVEMMNRHAESGSSSAVMWLAPIVNSEPELLQSLPHSALITLMCALPSTTPLVSKIAARLTDELSNPSSSSAILTFLMRDRFAQPKATQRDMVRRAFALLLQLPPDSHSQWLSKLLHSSFVAPSDRQQILVPALQSALLYENNLEQLREMLQCLLDQATARTESLLLSVSAFIRSRSLTVAQLLRSDAAMGVELGKLLLSGTSAKTSASSNEVTIVHLDRKKRTPVSKAVTAHQEVVSAMSELCVLIATNCSMGANELEKLLLADEKNTVELQISANQRTAVFTVNQAFKLLSSSVGNGNGNYVLTGIDS